MFYEPVWHQQAFNGHKYSFTHDLRRMIILYDGSPDFYAKLKNHMPGADAVALESRKLFQGNLKINAGKHGASCKRNSNKSNTEKYCCRFLQMRRANMSMPWADC